MRSLQSPALRTVDVARRSGYSVQQVRDLERDGVLPPAPRTATGYRTYGASHLDAALAYRALAHGTGPVEAKRILRAVHARDDAEALALLDAAHARLHTERRDIALAREAAGMISGELIDDVRPSDAMGISELAAALGVRPSTLRHWEAEGLLVLSGRSSPGGRRRYLPAEARDARIVQQLRRAGYRVEALRALMPALRRTGRWEEVTAALAVRDAGLDTRSRALLDGAAALSGLLGRRENLAGDADAGGGPDTGDVGVTGADGAGTAGAGAGAGAAADDGPEGDVNA